MMRFVVQHPCHYGCDQHAKGQWYDKKRMSYRNPIRAYLALRKIRKENWRSSYRLVTRRTA
jgi:hypothetical protein